MLACLKLPSSAGQKMMFVPLKRRLTTAIMTYRRAHCPVKYTGMNMKGMWKQSSFSSAGGNHSYVNPMHRQLVGRAQGDMCPPPPEIARCQCHWRLLWAICPPAAAHKLCPLGFGRRQLFMTPCVHYWLCLNLGSFDLDPYFQNPWWIGTLIFRTSSPPHFLLPEYFTGIVLGGTL